MPLIQTACVSIGIFLLASFPIAASTGDLSLDATRLGLDVRVRIRAPRPFGFSLRQITSPAQLIVEVKGPRPDRVVGLGPINLHPVLAFRASTDRSGSLRLVIDLTGPVIIGAEVMSSGKILVLLLRQQLPETVQGSVRAGPPTSGQAIEMVRLRHVGATDMAFHLRRLLPDLVVLADEKGSSLLLRGTAEAIAQAKQLIAALDVAPANAEIAEAILLKVLKPDVLTPLLITMFPDARIRTDPRLNAVVVAAAPRSEGVRSSLATTRN